MDATARRRWIGSLALITALGMLIAGQTVLKERLQNMAFLLYWCGCFTCTCAAIVLAFIDARTVQQRTRKEARDLLQTALHDIEIEARTKPGRTKNNGGKS